MDLFKRIGETKQHSLIKIFVNLAVEPMKSNPHKPSLTHIISIFRIQYVKRRLEQHK